MLRYIVVLAVFGVISGLLFVRLAPFDVNRFHRAVFPAVAGDYPGENSFIAIRELTASSRDVVEVLDGVIMNTPRTKRMAGLPGLELITYESRTALMGYPDYINVSIIPPGTVDNDGPLLAIRGQARFGKFDLNVNQKRIESWLEQLGPLTVAP